MSTEIKIDGVIGRGPNQISSNWVHSQLPTDGSEIAVKIHSEGGSVFEGFRIYDILAAYEGKKTAVIESCAFSIASFIPLACDEVVITPNGYMMLHNPRMGVEGDDVELAKSSEDLKKYKANMIEAYAKKTGRPENEVLDILKAETYLNAREAVAIGLADRIAEKPVTGRVFAQLNDMPHGVVSALFGADSNGNKETQREQPMSDSVPVAATIEEIESAFPKMKPSTVLACLKDKKPMASVAQAAVEEMMAENAALLAQNKELEEELTALRGASAEESTEEEAVAEEEPAEEEVTAQRTGAAPVARSVTGTATKTAKAQWDEAIEASLGKCGGNRARAVALANRENPGLRETYLAEVNR